MPQPMSPPTQAGLARPEMVMEVPTVQPSAACISGIMRMRLSASQGVLHIAITCATDA